MGCGGSRADAIIEPRYHESWTRETESTWLTNTDVESPVSVPNSAKMRMHVLLIYCYYYCSAKGKAVDAGLKEKRMVTTGTQCGKQAITTNGSSHQRRPRRSLTDVQCCDKVATGPALPLSSAFALLSHVVSDAVARL
uniref:BAALC binder of MAP3K1 and KLF4 b n=1 Tax=Fundulus heteroclitus TaxID=8078 RepID=A0A3Q2UFI8_FUNHE